MSTPYHAKYLAYELTKRLPAETAEKLSQSLANATVDLNPHQVEAALFAFRSPLSRGAILADEVGLGKTIEAGLIVSQLWAERKRRILVVAPASLRKQWNRELIEKFYIESCILETKAYNQAKKAGAVNPFDVAGKVVIVSYQFASAKMADLKALDWDLVVIDEAHRLRNVYKKSNKIARNLREAIGHRPKVLLKGDFRIDYAAGEEYIPDFAVETAEICYMIEPKGRDEMTDQVVQAKAKAAVLWCQRATEHAGGKPWKYVLVPHDVVDETKTVAGLAASWGVDSNS